MKRRPYALLPWMVLTAAAVAQTRSADVLYTHFDAYPTHGLRVADECFIPVDEISAWGWSAQIWADTASVKAEGKSFDVPFRNVGGRTCIPLTLAVKKLGANAEWVGNTDTLVVYGAVTDVSVRDGRLRIQTSLDCQPKATTLSDPPRLVVDLSGVRLDPIATKLDLDSSAHITQYKPNTVRIVIDSPSDVSLERINGPATHDMDVLFRSPDSQISAPTSPPLTTPTQPAVQPPIPPLRTTPAPTPTVQPAILQVNVESETDNQLNLLIPAHLNGIPLVEKPDASTLKVTLPGTALTESIDYKVSSPSVTAVTSTVETGKTVVTLSLVRPMGAEVVTGDAGVRIQLIKPNVGDGHLAGKLIVVDAGHGGWDSGTHMGECLEKDLTLPIATYIAQGLTREGATVIMTRKTDVFIPLTTRGQIANRNHADLFISSHINSTGGSGDQSGTIVFHHIGKGVSRVLAECIDQEIAKVSGIPNIGVWSDGKIYHSGFAVLRETTMPGVLIEYGFMNHGSDRRRMFTSEFQHAVAEAVVRGIKVYLGDAKAN